MPQRSRIELAGLAVLVLATLVLGVRHMQRRAEAERPPAAVAAGAVVRSAPAASPAALVHVTGAVRNPGVYRLRAGARVRDAVRRAGGPSRRADLEALNLAARVADAQQVVVPLRAGADAATGPSASAPAAPAPVSLSTATEAQLDELDGVGPALAARIVAERTRRGGFRGVEDLADVPGIGPKRLEALRAAVAP